jgi:hypothetical protein
MGRYGLSRFPREPEVLLLVGAQWSCLVHVLEVKNSIRKNDVASSRFT